MSIASNSTALLCSLIDDRIVAGKRKASIP